MLNGSARRPEPEGALADRPRGKVDRRRLLGLFRPYRLRLGTVLFLILISAGLGMVSPFLLRAVLDQAIPQRDTTLLILLVAGMIAIAVATGALGVAQTLISNTVGQRVMHDLRAAVYRHLQRLSLAFFTRTRTGEIQSRIANDIGGVQGVVTSTATSVVSNVASVQVSFAAMPALIYLFAGLTIAGGGQAITLGTLVAFTTLQTRLFFPVQSLLSVGVDVQSSLALFERVFEYLELPVEIAERDR